LVSNIETAHSIFNLSFILHKKGWNKKSCQQ
jgi:hypothetical protein